MLWLQANWSLEQGLSKQVRKQYFNKLVRSDGSCSEEDFLCISSLKCIDAWILDSGCFCHMTPHREQFNSFKSGYFGFVYLGDDKTCTIIGKGKIKISLDDDGECMLSEVCYVPELRKNLISLGTLKGNGYAFWSDGDKDIMRVNKGAMTLMTTKRSAENIYKLLGCITMGNIASVKTDNDATKL